MRRGSQVSAVLLAVLFLAGVFTSQSALAGSKQTLTGEVGDSMCGRKHMQGTATDCTKTCTQHGSKYALVVGDKIYAIETNDKAVLAVLDQQAGKNATLTGTVSGDNIEVSSAVAAK
jgi:hypothetical protein